MNEAGELVMKIGVFQLVTAVIAVISTTALVIMWFINYFQSKRDADLYRIQVDDRFKGMNNKIEAVEQKTETAQNAMNRVAQDVSYIRGLLEPRPPLENR